MCRSRHGYLKESLALSKPMARRPVEVARLLHYNSWARRKYLNLFGRLPWRILVRHRDASFGSVRDILLHTLQVNSIWMEKNFGVRSLRATTGVLDSAHWSSYHSMSKILSVERRLDKATLRFVDALRPSDLYRKVLFEVKGRKGTMTWEEGLWHLVEEELQHRGEMIALLWEDDIEPPWTNFPRWHFSSMAVKPMDSLYVGSDAILQSDGGYVKRPSNAPKKSGRLMVLAGE